METITTIEKINEAIKLAEKLAVESEIQTNGFVEYWYNFSANHWQKEEKSRIYLNLKYGRSRKWTRGVQYCIDLNTEKVFDCSHDYNNANERGIMKQIADHVFDFLFES